MDDKLSRRQFFKKTIKFIITLILSSTVGLVYAKYIEPRRLSVNKLTITSKKLPQAFHDVKVLQFSDIHLGYHYSIDQLETLINKMNDLKPDLILFTGDLMDEPNQYPYTEQLVQVLSTLHAPLGKFGIFGNHDHGGYGTEIYEAIMKKAGFQLLKNSHMHVKRKQDSIIIAGTDDWMLGRPDIQQTFSGITSENQYIIVLSHEPDPADYIAAYPASLQLSGHSHGGQVQLPFFGPIVTPPLADRYVEGLHTVGANDMKLYVNRGIGTTRQPYRFMSVPELTLFTLKGTE